MYTGIRTDTHMHALAPGGRHHPILKESSVEIFFVCENNIIYDIEHRQEDG